MSFPRTTHTWLQPIFDRLEGKTSEQLQLGSPTGVIGLYGATGYPRLTSGGQITGTTGLGQPVGASGMPMWNGGTGTHYTGNDIVKALKNLGVLPQ